MLPYTSPSTQTYCTVYRQHSTQSRSKTGNAAYVRYMHSPSTVYVSAGIFMDFSFLCVCNIILRSYSNVFTRIP